MMLLLLGVLFRQADRPLYLLRVVLNARAAAVRGHG